MTMKPVSHHHSGHNHNELIQLLMHCALTCETCSSACLDEPDVSMMARCIELDRDCADICSLAARLLQRDGEIAHHFLAVCEEMCRLCAGECNKHEHNHCKVCAEICHKCAEACHTHLEVVHAYTK
ncbi:MAG: four-helix bundle copper-binding protein [Chitinophagaceae bacterium]|nr:four-helix bundle copper-binding protein [Chitinophagaceae bacterium]